MTILTEQSIRRCKIIDPWMPRTKYLGVSFGQSFAGYDIRLDKGVNLEAGRTSLAISRERFTMPCNVMGIVHDKSTWARLGIQVQNTVIEPGWIGYLTLEISYSPLSGKLTPLYTIPGGVGIAQVIFHLIDTHVEGYEGKYQDAGSDVQPAIFTLDD